ncbi:response regulator transcription factor [Streptomyces sp. NPDC017546]|uniref:response regulator transcription factor n=1 Tax=unclassified Streptomyces TaxID=2593676 RepID=UPI00235E015E|nr:response regulator transcription factor [Streptomyces sp. MMBL 11-1]
MPELLIVEDDAATVVALRGLLVGAGYEVVTAADGREGLRLLFSQRPDLMVLDLVVPGLDGWRVMARARDMSDLPVLVVSGLDDVGHRVRALRAGADDYLVKPFHGEELVARVEALLRRAGHRQWAGERVGEHLRLVPERRAVVWYGEEARLSDLEYRLLQLLVRNRGRVVTTEQLLTRVWGDESAVDGDRVKFAVLRLRRKLRGAAGPGGRDPVEAVRGLGYRFISAEEAESAGDKDL